MNENSDVIKDYINKCPINKLKHKSINELNSIQQILEEFDKTVTNVEIQKLINNILEEIIKVKNEKTSRIKEFDDLHQLNSSSNFVEEVEEEKKLIKRIIKDKKKFTPIKDLL